MDLVLINANKFATITATDQQEYYENYYTSGDASHGITNVRTFKTVSYKEIYPNIDMILSAAGHGMEYSFVVHPGGNVNDIKLRWIGAEKCENLENGGIRFSNTLGSMEESVPKSFVDGKLLASSFIKNGVDFSFKVEKYNNNKDLLIDPSLTWATYFGGSGYQYTIGVSTDGSGNVFITGYTTSTSGIATSGAYKTNDNGGGNWMGYLAKFSSSGSIAWATYYGGGSYDVTNSVTTDGSGNVYLSGQTYSTIGIATSGTYQTSNGGTYDAFLVKFSSSGSLTWGTYFGGSGSEGGGALNIDVSGNIYMIGSTSSTSKIATSGAYQTSYGGGSADGFLAKFTSSGGLSWATYYGGSGFDETTGLCTDASGNV